MVGKHQKMKLKVWFPREPNPLLAVTKELIVS